MDDNEFDKIADEELQYLERTLGELDPDEVEVELSSGVLTLSLADGSKIIVNSHRAAGEIWMAAFRQAWHFAPVPSAAGVRWQTAQADLRSTLASLLSERLGRAIAV